MTRTKKQWLKAAPWEAVLELNKALCQAQQFEPLNNEKSCEAARRLWQKSVEASLSLQETLEVCNKCHGLGPFTFNNGNTFAAIGRTLIDECLKTAPPVEAQIIRTTVCHYIVGLIGRKELQQVLRHFEPLLDSSPPAPRPQPESPRRTTLTQEQSAPA